ncbi:hypothetical protein FQN50_005943 [Emmonsiellopsis sp. PD_5]|nr:hypothetical protein FQN50_005943 [Emmonsiellopsis sp. PD_5]
MPTPAESNACSACARSKRKCGRQMPSCARCAERNISCLYPPSRTRAASSYRPLLPDASRGAVPSVGDDGLLAEAALADDDLMLDLAFPLMDADFAAPSSLTHPPTTRAPATSVDWFLAPETWRISHRMDPIAAGAVGKATMKKYIAVLQSWFDRWVTTGSNPFIHPRLYSANFPACVQVAYGALASYIHRTPANTDTVLQIIEDRSTELLRENGAVLTMDRAGGVEEEWADREQDVDTTSIDLFAQLTRLHALMVYQLIGLFDGDIRSRHVTQGRMAVQDSWARKLFHSAARALSLSSPNTHAVATHLTGCLPRPSTPSQQQWYLWILSESIRRTWLVAVSVSPIFSALQRGWAACPGGIMYTNRSGVWDAGSAAEWEEQCAAGGDVGVGVGFLQRFECARLFEDVGPGEVDEFGMAMLDMTVNGEVLGGWRGGGGGGGIRV